MRAHVLAICACLLMTLAALLLRHILDVAAIVMLYLLTVFLVALKLGRGASVTAVLVNVILFDYFFVPPHLAFVPDEAQYVVILAVMLAVALLTAGLTAGLQEQKELISRREHQAQRLFRLARDLAAAASLWEVQGALDDYLTGTGCRGMILFIDRDGNLPPIDEPLESFVRRALDEREPVECAQCGNTLLIPLVATLQVRGIMVMTGPAEHRDMGHEREILLLVASVIANALERLHYVEVAQDTQLQVTSERLRASLLSALSHDLRTPLTALVGLADSLALSATPPDTPAREAAAAIRDQARAMSNLLGNLLDMARLQAGKVHLHKEWQLFDDVVGSSLRLLKSSHAPHPVRVQIAAGLPLVEFDAVLIERVIWNLLENAAKYSSAESAIEVTAFVEGNHACLSVCDNGPGFPAGGVEPLFEMFARGVPESTKPGVGLGLAISRAIVEAHGGTIHGENRPAGGACVTIRLPVGSPPPFRDEEAAAPGVAR